MIELLPVLAWPLVLLLAWASAIVAVLWIYHDMRHPTVSDDRLAKLESRADAAEQRIGEIELSQGLRGQGPRFRKA